MYIQKFILVFDRWGFLCVMYDIWCIKNRVIILRRRDRAWKRQHMPCLFHVQIVILFEEHQQSYGRLIDEELCFVRRVFLANAYSQ